MTTKRGGHRDGAGRKKLMPGNKRIQVAFRLAPDVVAWLRQQPNQAHYLEALIRADINAWTGESG